MQHRLENKVLKATMGLVFRQAGKVNKCIQNFGCESSWKMITWKTQKTQNNVQLDIRAERQRVHRNGSGPCQVVGTSISRNKL